MVFNVSSCKSRRVGLFVLAIPFFFLASYVLTVPYVNGDQEFYRSFYNSLSYAQFTEIALLQYINTGSAEPLYGFLMWVGAVNKVDKDIYIAIFNTILCCAILRFLLNNKAGLLFCFFMFSNYYLMVILTSAERLKFAYIFLAIAAANSSYVRTKIWILASALFHFQSFILLSSMASGYLSKIQLKRRVRFKILLLYLAALLIGVALLVVFFKLFSGYLTNKINSYSDLGGIEGVINIVVLAMFSILIFNKKSEVLISLAACALFSLIVGPERVNMIAVSLFIYFSVLYRKASHPLTFVIMAYFSLKSIDYLFRVFSYGDGFHEGGLW